MPSRGFNQSLKGANSNYAGVSKRTKASSGMQGGAFIVLLSYLLGVLQTYG